MPADRPPPARQRRPGAGAQTGPEPGARRVWLARNLEYLLYNNSLQGRCRPRGCGGRRPAADPAEAAALCHHRPNPV